MQKDLRLIPGSERSPGGGHGNSLQYSCLGNPMDRDTWWATWGFKRVEHDLATKQQQQQQHTKIQFQKRINKLEQLLFVSI